MAPAASNAASKSSPTRLKAKVAAPSIRPVTTADKVSEKTIASPSRTFLSGFKRASQSPFACGSRSVASIRASVSSPPAPLRCLLPLRRAGMTLVSFKTSRSPGRKNSGRLMLAASVMRSGVATSRRDDERGRAGRVAINPSGSSKSKSDSFNGSTLLCRHRPTENFAEHARRQD